MGRIRSNKPELIATTRYAKLTDAAVRMFHALILFADDRGNYEARAKHLDGQIFSERRRGAAAVGRLLAELERARLIDLYTVDGDEYLSIVGWSEKGTPTHQRIEKPQPPRFPQDKARRSWNEFRERSGTDRDSDSDLDSDPEGELERKREELAAAPSAAPGGWRPPAGGRAERAARARVQAGALAQADVEACWAKFVEMGRHTSPNADAIAASWVTRQRRSTPHAPDEPGRAADYEAPPWR